METKPNRPTAVLYVHGMGGSPTESEHYRALFPNCDIVGLNYQTFCPEETGIGLYWKDVVYIREKPYRWHVPTHILYGAADRLIPYDAITTFADAHGADVTVLEDGKHWFHTDEQMAFLDGWIRSLQR
ncbi:MAG: alpha/beta hydrolase [Clostridia bacterium]|nr:alpha/beta hydrolase [Clostridia bacterium]